MKINFGSGEKEIIASTYTLVIYEQEFGTDLIHDVYGRHVIERPKTDDDGNVLPVVDYTRFNWTSMVKALWAMLKTADPSVPPFMEWARENGGVNLFALNNEMMEELDRGFFPSDDSEAEE